MKVVIESTPNLRTTNSEPLVVLNGIIKAALIAKSLDELTQALNLYTDTYGYHYGCGSSHMWVKQKGNDERILLITE